MDASKRQQLVRKAMQELAVDHREEAEAIVMRIHFEQGIDEIARKTRVTKGTVSKRCGRAQRFLERIMENLLSSE